MRVKYCMYVRWIIRAHTRGGSDYLLVRNLAAFKLDYNRGEGDSGIDRLDMETFQMECCVRDCHVYKDISEAVVGEELRCQRKRNNNLCSSCQERRNSSWLPASKSITSLCSFSRKRRLISCSPTGRRRYLSDLPQGGLEIPSLLSLEEMPKRSRNL